MNAPMPHLPLAGGVALPRVLLGGHEYLADGRSRAFNEDLARAVTPGHIFPGFGGPLRLAVLAQALALGISGFDVTIDSEKEALGRNLAQLGAGHAVIQTRPEGMVYSYDPGNRKLVTPGALRAEVRRALGLLRRDRLDLLNIGILRDAFGQAPDYAARLAGVVRELKAEGLIRCAAADTFSGYAVYARMLEQGVFDTVNLNFNIADDGAAGTLLPMARAAGVRVVAREVFIKGELFRLAAEAGIEDMAPVAAAAVKWVAAHEGIDALIAGARTPEELVSFVSAAANPEPTAAESRALAAVMALPRFQLLREKNRAAFAQPLPT